ncbi:MAG: hypothetical protein QNJ92_10645 [Alphaproteobacteria bacterium]|nr:hypothetical protein [Alphaproteobacteria bacterium]
MSHRAGLLFALATLAWSLPASAADRLYAVDEAVSFHLSEPGGHLDFLVEVFEPGLLAFETDDETLRKLAVEVLDMNGAVIGRGGARISAAAAYVVRLRRHARYEGERGFGEWDGRGDGVLAFWSPDIDAFEPNDSRAEAAVLELGPEQPIAGGPVTLFPADDEDHFVLRLAEPGYVTPRLRVPAFASAAGEFRLKQADGDGRAWRLREGRLLEQGDVALVLSSDVALAAPVELAFEYAPNWDPCEPNQEAAAACELGDGRPVAFSLFPRNDVDWYSLRTDGPGAILLTLSGLPAPSYDDAGKLIRGLQITVRSVVAPGEGRNRARHRVTHGTIFIEAPSEGEYRFALTGRWIDSNPLRAMELSARFVDLATANADARLAIFGVYGTRRDEASVFELTSLAGLGLGNFHAARGAGDLTAAVSTALGLPDEPEPRPSETDPAPQTAAEPSSGARAAARAEEAPSAAASTPQSAARLSPEEAELKRLMDLDDMLRSSPQATLWLHHYAQPDGSILKRLEATQEPALAGTAQVVRSEALSAKMSRRRLVRAIQEIE